MRWQACPGHHYARKSVAPDKGKHSLCNGKHCNHSRELGGERGGGRAGMSVRVMHGPLRNPVAM